MALLAVSGHWDEGTAIADRAIAMLGPSAPWYLWYPAAERHWVRGEYQEAYDAFQHANIEGYWLSHLDLAFTLPFLDRLDEAKAHVAKLLRDVSDDDDPRSRRFLQDVLLRAVVPRENGGRLAQGGVAGVKAAWRGTVADRLPERYPARNSNGSAMQSPYSTGHQG